MPVYTFQCPKCKACFESLIRLEDYEKGPNPSCTVCNSILERAYFPRDMPAFNLVGKGFKNQKKEKRIRK